MPSKNSLSSLTVKPKNSLLEAQNKANKLSQGIAGRKPKPILEKQSELVGLRFTKSELKRIKNKAGLIPIATYLKNALKENTDILNLGTF